MNMKLTAPWMGSTDVNPHDDFANESVGVDRENGLWVINADGQEIRFDREVQAQIYEALDDFLFN